MNCFEMQLKKKAKRALISVLLSMTVFKILKYQVANM